MFSLEESEFVITLLTTLQKCGDLILLHQKGALSTNTDGFKSRGFLLMDG